MKTLDEVIEWLQEQAIYFEVAGDEDVFKILDTTADELRELQQLRGDV